MAAVVAVAVLVVGLGVRGPPPLALSLGPPLLRLLTKAQPPVDLNRPGPPPAGVGPHEYTEQVRGRGHGAVVQANPGDKDGPVDPSQESKDVGVESVDEGPPLYGCQDEPKLVTIRDYVQ